ncbi:MAG: choice-of-anchor Q domain-containing protein [Planctomycetota bacterium]|jgi:CSLREA domain-containing protein
MLHRLSQWACRTSARCKPPPGPPPCRLEPLEPRVLLSGTVYLVNSLGDDVESDGQITLREAIEAANTNSPVTDDVPAGSDSEIDIIRFEPTALGSAHATIELGGSELSITDDLSIDGPGAEQLAIDAAGLSRVIFIVGQETDVTLSGLTITGGDMADLGGGVYKRSGTLTLIDSTVSGNTAHAGGGVMNFEGVATILNTLITRNSAVSGGGGIRNFGELNVIGSTISGNTATERGGGVYQENVGQITLVNSTVTGNATEFRGGGINSFRGTVTLTNSTVTGNHAPGQGGGIENESGFINLNNTIVALNTAPFGPDVAGGVNTQNGLVGADPIFARNPSAGADQAWGTDDDDYGDLRPAPDSPAVDAGDNDLLPPDFHDLDSDGDTAEPLPVDQAGAPRVYNTSVDIGAHEAQAYLSGDFNLDGHVGVPDLIVWAGGFGTGTRFTQGDANLDGQVGVPDLILWAQLFGQSLAPAASISSGAGPTLLAVSPTSELTLRNDPTTQNGRWEAITGLLELDSDPEQRKDVRLNIIGSISPS